MTQSFVTEPFLSFEVVVVALLVLLRLLLCFLLVNRMKHQLFLFFFLILLSVSVYLFYDLFCSEDTEIEYSIGLWVVTS